jgi:hypothetical protein
VFSTVLHCGFCSFSGQDEDKTTDKRPFGLSLVCRSKNGGRQACGGKFESIFFTDEDVECFSFLSLLRKKGKAGGAYDGTLDGGSQFKDIPRRNGFKKYE